MQPVQQAAPPAEPEVAGRRRLPPATVPRLAVAAVAAYAGAQVIADITSVKIGVAFGRAVDMGTWIYPITFTLRDVVHKMLGRRAARTLVVSCGVVNLFMALYLQWVARAPSHETYLLGDEFKAVLGPLWRIVVASIIAEVIASCSTPRCTTGSSAGSRPSYQWARVAVSNAVSIPVDNALFAVLAFGSLPFLTDDALTLPWSAVWDIFLVNLTVKFAVSALSLPLIYVSPDRDWSADPDDA